MLAAERGCRAETFGPDEKTRRRSRVATNGLSVRRWLSFLSNGSKDHDEDSPDSEATKFLGLIHLPTLLLANDGRCWNLNPAVDISLSRLVRRSGREKIKPKVRGIFPGRCGEQSLTKREVDREYLIEALRNESLQP